MATNTSQVANEDVQSLLNYLKSRTGQVVLTEHLHQRYATLVRADGREPGNQMTLARALNRAGWERTLVRRSRGSRGRQRYYAASAYVVPGDGPVLPVEHQRMGVTLRALLGDQGSAMLRKTAVHEEYDRQARRGQWTWPMSHDQISAWMTRQGFHSMIYGGKRDGGAGRGQPCWYVTRDQANWGS